MAFPVPTDRLVGIQSFFGHWAGKCKGFSENLLFAFISVGQGESVVLPPRSWPFVS